MLAATSASIGQAAGAKLAGGSTPNTTVVQTETVSGRGGGEGFRERLREIRMTPPPEAADTPEERQRFKRKKAKRAVDLMRRSNRRQRRRYDD